MLSEILGDDDGEGAADTTDVSAADTTDASTATTAAPADGEQGEPTHGREAKAMSQMERLRALKAAKKNKGKGSAAVTKPSVAVRHFF